MRKFWKNTNFILVVIALAMATELFSCSSARLSNMWRDPSYNNGPLRSLFVIAVKKNAAARRIWEDGFANALKDYGVKVTPSYQVFTNELPDTNHLITTAKREGFDGVVIIGRAISKTNYEYVPGYVVTRPVYLFDPWYRTYYGYYQNEYNPGEVIATKVIRNQVDIWVTKGKEHMIWTGTGEEIDPGSSKDANKEIVKVILPELIKQGIIPEKK